MTKRVFYSISAVAISIIIAVAVLITGLQYSYFTTEQMNRLREETHMVTQGVLLMSGDYLSALERGENRITWIDRDGTVLYDSHSDSNTMENHLQREEIAEAAANGSGQSKRYSDTLTEQYLYYAEKMEDGTIIRLAVSQRTSLSLLWNMVKPIGLIVIMAVMVSLVLATRLSKSVITPLNNLNLDSPMENSSYEELYPLLHRIDSQQKEIRLRTYELQRKKDELETIVGSMNEGIVLLKANGYVMSINDKARNLLEITGRGINKDFEVICRNEEIIGALDKVWKGNSTETVLDLAGGRYQMNASPVYSDNKVAGIALLFFDVTEKEKSEQLRREFTANVSHELKSPLHTIAGYSELIMSGIAREEDIAVFSQRINAEAKRMSGIIQDIISLSQLDEGITEMKIQPVELYSVASSAVSNLKEISDKAGVNIEITGEKAVVNGILALIGSVVHNLCDNAIKYNHRGGFVKVTVKDNGDEAAVTVEDNGIGIAPEHHNHVFERFYRVDKSRSRENGGSGLGLSIVKHAVKIHNGRIEMSSVPGEGTKITVILPK